MTSHQAPNPTADGAARDAVRRSLGRARFARRLQFRLGERTTMILIAIVIGIAGGFGAVFFRWLIGTFQHLAWGPDRTPLEAFSQSPWFLRITIPAIGGLLVGLIVKFFAPEARGHGVPEVMNAVARQGGVIRPVVAVAKSFASAISIATGGSVGREGPIVQIGSAIGSTVGQWLRLSTRRIRICVGCGAAAGIAATFNAPIAGAFFAAEVILGEFGTGAFGPVVISSVAATAIARSFLGDVPAFEIPEYALLHPAEILVYAVLGVVTGVVAVAYIKTLHWFEELFDRPGGLPDYVQPVVGGLAIGSLGLVLPQIMGVGYETIEAALRGNLGLGILIWIVVGKLVATSFTLGSGGSGGVFAPSLLMGAALGGVVGEVVGRFAPFPMAPSGAYAVVGMGAMVAAATHAPITAILIIFEMTGDYRVILGLMASIVVATQVAQRLQRESIYTIKLARRGIRLEAGQEVNVLRKLRVQDVMHPEVETVSPATGLEDLFRRMVQSPGYEFFTIDDAGNLSGVISVDDLRRLLPEREELSNIVIARDLAASPVIFVREDDSLDHAMRQFGKRRFGELPVLPPGDSMRPIGVLRRDEVINAYNKEILKVDLAGTLSSQIVAAAKLKVWETIGGYVLSQMEIPAHFAGRTLEDLRLRRDRGVQILLVEHHAEEGAPDGTTGTKSGRPQFELAGRDTVLRAGEGMVVFGPRDKVDALARETR